MLNAIISDIHGNIEALEAAVDAAILDGAGRIVFGGDAVGYGPDPVACLNCFSTLAEKGILSYVGGNHDRHTLRLAGTTLHMKEAVKGLPGNDKAKKSWIYSVDQMTCGMDREHFMQNAKRGEEGLAELEAMLWNQIISEQGGRVRQFGERIKPKEIPKKGVFSKALGKTDIETVPPDRVLRIAADHAVIQDFLKRREALRDGYNALVFLKKLVDAGDIVEGRAHYFHSVPRKNLKEEIKIDTYVASKYLAERYEFDTYIPPTDLCERYSKKGNSTMFLFGGHTHCATKKIAAVNGLMYVNVGSAFPRPRQNVVTYVLYDDTKEGKEALKTRTAEYSVATTLRKSREAGLGDPRPKDARTKSA